MINKILGTKSGWLIPVSVQRETKKAFIVVEKDTKRERRVCKDSTNERLFDDCDSAMVWQGVLI